MVCRSRTVNPRHGDLFFSVVSIWASLNHYILGLKFDRKLTFDANVRGIVSRVSQRIGILRLVKRIFVNTSVLLLCYFAFIRHYPTESLSVTRHHPTASLSVTRHHPTASLSVTLHHPTASLSVIRRHPTASLSVTRHHPILGAMILMPSPNCCYLTSHLRELPTHAPNTNTQHVHPTHAPNTCTDHASFAVPVWVHVLGARVGCTCWLFNVEKACASSTNYKQ